MLKIRLAFAALLTLALIEAVTAQTKSLRFVSPMRPPFTEVAGKPRYALDLVEEALRRVGISATTTIVPPGEYGAALISGNYDGTAVGWRDSERERLFLLSEPYLENRLVLVARRGTDTSAPTLAALTGKRVAVITGYAYGDNFERLGPSFVRTGGEPESLRMLLDGKVDYVLMDELVVQYMVEAYPNETRERLQIGTTPLLVRPVHIHIRRTIPDGQAIVDNFNKQIKLMVADRTYHRLLHVNWIYTDVDGDGLNEFVSASDQAGTSQPARAYNLFSEEKLTNQVKKEQERYFFGGAVYNGWSSVPDRYKVDHLDRPDAVHPTARVFTFSWK